MHWTIDAAPLFASLVCALRARAWYCAISLAVYTLAFSLYVTGRKVDDPSVREFYQSGLARFLYASAARSLALSLAVEFLFGKLLWKCCVGVPTQLLAFAVSLLYAHTVTLVDFAFAVAAATYAAAQILFAALAKKGYAKKTAKAAVVVAWTAATPRLNDVDRFLAHLLVFVTFATLAYL